MKLRGGELPYKTLCKHSSRESNEGLGRHFVGNGNIAKRKQWFLRAVMKICPLVRDARIATHVL